MRRLKRGRGPLRRACRGMTLVELMIGLAISGLLLMAVMPSLSEYQLNARLRESGHALFAEALLAQSEAVKRNATVRLTAAGGSVQMMDLRDASNPVLLRARSLAPGVSVETMSLDFGSEGRPTPLGSEAAANLSLAGQTCSDLLRCPGLRVDAGGAVRLCGNHLQSCN